MLIELMEAQYAAMPEPARDAWDRVWYAVETRGVTSYVPAGRERAVGELPAATLYAAFAALDPDSALRALRDELARLVETGASRTVAIRWR
jgi:hypothetical protein